ncbi:50S ribosomal protein L29 [Candidatus Gracilibacteria bacterium]|nr:50S ribosomal protein L29 [Candidatus Gracilibacteria bacterium]
MKMQELRQLTPKKLLAELEKARRELAGERFQIRTGKNQNTAQVRKKKVLIARILTLLGSKNTVSSPSQEGLLKKE